MEFALLTKSIPKILAPIPTPVIFWGFILIIVAVFIIVFRKMWDLKGE